MRRKHRREEKVLAPLLDDLAEWLDEVLALGWMSITPSQLDAARPLAEALEQLGVTTCAGVLRELLGDLERRFAETDAAARESLDGRITHGIGRLSIALAVAREAAEIESLAKETPPSATPET